MQNQHADPKQHPLTSMGSTLAYAYHVLVDVRFCVHEILLTG